MKKRAALLVDDMQLDKWQLDALEAAGNSVDIVLILNCQNTYPKKHYLKNFLYYILNIFTLKNYLTRKKKIKLIDTKVVDFKSIYNSYWQTFPKKIYKELESINVDFIIKFGMSLLYLDENNLLPPILSYHHGDPSKYRGRPAGFYEIINGEKTTGIIVQTLTNKLDAGDIYAFAESKVFNFSYKKTAINFYSSSTPLLNKAIINLSNKSKIKRSVNGKNYRLPSNLKVLHFLFVIISNAIKKLVYGLFFEKRWKVAITKNSLKMREDEVLSSSDFNVIPINKKYNFYADPFFSDNGEKIRFEALDNKTGLGDIVELEANDFKNQITLMSGQHFSYPCSFLYEDKEYLLPEVASHSAQYFCEINKLENRFYLKGLEENRIVDATLYIKNGKCYLFFGESQSAHSVLNLWVSDTPYSVFQPHPMNPITISPKKARMGGKVINYQKKLIRFGQNNSGEYGESLSIMMITKLSDESYEELKLGTITIDNFSGPHSISFNSDMTKLLIDYYNSKFSLFAGVRRIKARLKKSN